jgi:N-formylglutamate amidohydrolase
MDKNWKLFESEGPVFGTSIHSGHYVRESIQKKMKISAQKRRYEEDPLTESFALLCDHALVCHNSRFEVDLNRQRDIAVYAKPTDAWGLEIWKEKLNQDEIDASLKSYDAFYQSMKMFFEKLFIKHDKVLLLDFHSYNQRDSSEFPDIDLGFTTVNQDKFLGIATAFQKSLELNSPQFSIGINKRFDDGGHWPEWVYANYKQNICTITVEFKKCFMDENTGIVDLEKLDQLKFAIGKAISDVRELL